MIEAILHLTEHSLAFRRSSDAFCTARNGLRQLTATIDRILEGKISKMSMKIRDNNPLSYSIRVNKC
jgi:hypothetical protein